MKIFDIHAHIFPDPIALKAFEMEGRYLGQVIAMCCSVLDPEKVILGGGVAAQKENLTAPLQELVKDLCFGGELGEIAQIVTSELGNDAGIIGAANLV